MQLLQLTEIHFLPICTQYSGYNGSYAPKMLVAIRVYILDNSDLIEITANSLNSYPGFSFGNIKVKLVGSDATYTNKICPLLSDMSMNFENSICISQQYFAKHKLIRINEIGSNYICESESSD